MISDPNFSLDKTCQFSNREVENLVFVIHLLIQNDLLGGKTIATFPCPVSKVDEIVAEASVTIADYNRNHRLDSVSLRGYECRSHQLRVFLRNRADETTWISASDNTLTFKVADQRAGVKLASSWRRETGEEEE